MIHAVCFSKGRPMQLRAYLESMIFCTGFTESVTVITPDVELYKDIATDLPYIQWIDEKGQGGFHNAFTGFVNSLPDEDIIFFGVDDCVFFRPFNIKVAEWILVHQLLIGFTFRLGKNVLPYDPSWNRCKDSRFIMWDWRGKPSHYGYPMEVTCSAYRVKDIKGFLSFNKRALAIPNDLESFMVQYAYSELNQKYPLYGMLNSLSFAGAADLNRVQDVYQNKVQGGEEFTSENMLKLYEKGHRIAWWSYFDLSPKDCFLGKEGLVIT